MTDLRAILSESEAKAVLPIVADGRMFGTCFHVHREAGKSYLLTALHVLDEVIRIGQTPTVDGVPILATLANLQVSDSTRLANDLALLEIAALPDDVAVLPLSDDIGNNQSVALWGHSVDPADVKYYRFHGILGNVRGSVGFLGQASGGGEHGLGINVESDQPIPSGFSGGPVFDPATRGVLGVTVSRQAKDRGDAVRTLGVARLLEFSDRSSAEAWERIITQILVPIFAIPQKRAVVPADTSRLRRALTLASIALFFFAGTSIWLAYSEPPIAWQLQFNYLQRTSCTGIAIGWIIEIAFTALLLVIARAMLIWHFPDDLAQVIESVLYPEKARDHLTTVGAAVFVAGFALFLVTVFGLWAYHVKAAPDNLQQWAHNQLDLAQTKYKACGRDIQLLTHELNNNPLPLYRATYLKYFPYSFVNFALIAVPLAIVLGTAAGREVAALSSLSAKIKTDQAAAATFTDAREWFYLTRTMRGPFQDYRLHSEQIVRRSLATFALFSPLAMFCVTTSNLAESAFAYAVLAAVIIFVGPLCGIASAIYSYQRQITSLLKSIAESRTLPAPEKDLRSQEFTSAYGNQMWTTLFEHKVTLFNAVIYALLLIALILYWRMR